jgi:signal transduction histidine kinase
MKEGLNNLLRHSGAENVEFRAILKNGTCTIALKDDGAGFGYDLQAGQDSPGNGLANMRKRAQESGIDISIQSGRGTGTEIVLLLKI